MRTLIIIFSGLVCVAISGCESPKDDYDQISAELVNTQHLVKEANEAHLKVAAENRELKTTLRETQAKLAPTQTELDEVKKQLQASQNAHKKDVAALTKENESLQTENETAIQNVKKIQTQLTTCQSDLEIANKKNEGQQAMIARQNLIIKELPKSNASVKQGTAPEPQK